MRAASLFAGIDAVGIAVRVLGGQTVAYSEYDPTPRNKKRPELGPSHPDGEQYNQRVLAGRLPDAEPLGDVTKVDWNYDYRYLGMMPAAKITSDQLADAIRDYEEGSSLEVIADHLPITRQALWERFKRAGVQMRPQKRFKEENHFYRGGARGSDWAHNKVEQAIYVKKLVRPDTCEECGGSGQPYRDGRAAIQAHHNDYNKPLEVRWLCKGCHHHWHEENQAVPLREEVVSEEAKRAKFDFASAGFP